MKKIAIFLVIFVFAFSCLAYGGQNPKKENIYTHLKKIVTKVNNTPIERNLENLEALILLYVEISAFKYKMDEEDHLQMPEETIKLMGHSPDAFAEYVMREPRTLQQQMFNVMMVCIARWAEEKYFDLRNEDTIRICKKLKEVLDRERTVRFI